MDIKTTLPNISKDEVLRFVKFRGPIIPNELRKLLKVGDTMLLGAMLSELATKGQVKISHTKLGGSPFYYDPAKPESLEKAAEHLNEKDQRTFAKLKQERILRDDQQDSLTRVSLRNIKDFAVELTVNAPEGKVTFWKYYLLPNEEAEARIKEQLGMKKKPAPKKEVVKRVEERRVAQPKAAKEKQESLAPVEEIDDPFYEQIKKFFAKNSINIKEQKLIRKKSELDFVIEMATPMGRVEYYCKAKSKKRSNDGDLASAKLQGNAKQLPVIYLTTGEITKKAQEMLQKEFKGVVVKQL